MRIAMIVAGLLVGGIVIAALAIDQGEMIVLTSWDREGHEYETPLWIVEHDGAVYLRAIRPNARWLARIRERPDVELRRNGTRSKLVATSVSDAELRDHINRAMAAKYGTADRWWCRLLEVGNAVPVRLDPAR